MSKLREKFVNTGLYLMCNFPTTDNIDELEQISDDFAVKFAEFFEVYQGGTPNKKVLTELLQIFKNNHYE